MSNKWKKENNENTLESYDSKLPPSNVILEETVLGTIILSRDILNSCIQDFHENLFFNEKNKQIAIAIKSLYSRNVAVDLLTVVDETRKNKGVFEIPISYITQLTNKVASTANFEYHFKLVQEHALKRNLIQVCGNALRKSFELDTDVFDLYGETQLNLEKSLKNVISYQVQKVGGIHNEIIAKSNELIKTGLKAGVVTGLTMLDNVTNGWQKSDLIILAGRPSMGKTAAAVSMIIHPAVELNIPVAIFSLEMSAEQIVSRMQSYLSGVNVGKIVKKQLNYDDVNRLSLYAKQLEQAPIYIDDTPNISLTELKAKSRRLVNEQGVQLIVVDYLQLMRSGMNMNSREQEIAEISRGLKIIAKELKIPVIALSQLNRAVESRGADKKPMLADLRESGQIEQDADMVVFCYRPEYYKIENYEVGSQSFETDGLFMLLIEKHRNGELGEIPLKFISEQTKITNRQTNTSHFDNSFSSRTFVHEDNDVKDSIGWGDSSFSQTNDSDSLPF